MSRPWILVAPSSRGIGAALTRHLLTTTTAPILATCRSRDTTATKQALLEPLSSSLPPKTLEDVAPRLKVVRVDVTDEESVREAAEEARGLFPGRTHHLRLALAIPGILHPEKSPSQMDVEKDLDMFRVNCVGQMVLMKHFSDFLPRKSVLFSEDADDVRGLPGQAVWAAMSARVGSTTDNLKGGWYGYRASKAGVTSLAKSLDLWLRPRSGERALAVAYHPGTVKTLFSEGFWDTVPEGKLFEAGLRTLKQKKRNSQ
ncbi:hypothetical protein CCHL11_00637 [Colletotrichum chlorophyti]|uniref:Uncharacterized protein n=1 Tax=Colletotrichum chlorophyti TaxID=708187 RepID=A0A1Q8S527_9PEZI|nr:hypothetical protein CCHL11_00637 [Colletotrichum chlorophyti]